LRRVQSTSASSETPQPSDLLSYPSSDLAAALTDIDFRLFSQVTAKDVLIKIGWAGEKLK
jgi:hypothetical protein